MQATTNAKKKSQKWNTHTSFSPPLFKQFTMVDDTVTTLPQHNWRTVSGQYLWGQRSQNVIIMAIFAKMWFTVCLCWYTAQHSTAGALSFPLSTPLTSKPNFYGAWIRMNISFWQMSTVHCDEMTKTGDLCPDCTWLIILTHVVQHHCSKTVFLCYIITQTTNKRVK